MSKCNFETITFLYILDPPRCVKNQKRIYGVSRGEEIEVVCNLMSEPKLKSVRWAFNSSSQLIDIPQNEFTWESNSPPRGQAISKVTYNPKTTADYGTLLCWGENEKGMQDPPCVFLISPAGKKVLMILFASVL